MIEFSSITVKNFCSYGNHPTTIDLKSHDKTLVVGKNGRGKSTILLDGIFFALFGKPYRKVTKNQLVNSINKGDTLVELSFVTRGSTYVLRRGIKPNVFELFVDGTKMDNNVLNKDLQEHLEQDILQLNLQTFGQTVVLGSTSYTPFMKLEAARRREVVDDVLNVGVYTKMAKLAKEDLDITNKAVSKLQGEIDVMKASILGQKKVIDVMISSQQDSLTQYQEDLDSLKIRHQELKRTVEEKTHDLSCLLKVKDPELSNFELLWKQAERKLDQFDAKIESYNQMTTCPSCLQVVTEDHKHSIVDKSKSKREELVGLLDQAKQEYELAKEQQPFFVAYTAKLEIMNRDIDSLNRQIADVNRDIVAVENRISKLSLSSSGTIQIEKEKLKQMMSDCQEKARELSALKSTKAIQELSITLLKDSGIKARIVKEYLPVINALINKYLKGYDFAIDFELDENFDEVIKSRGRENFSYNSFSEGEKEKIDYSIMLALRKVGASKNSAHLNILVLDEILDGSLDSESRAYTLDMLASDMDKSNIFVISHTEANPSYYDRILRVDKKGHFSYITDSDDDPNT